MWRVLSLVITIGGLFLGGDARAADIFLQTSKQSFEKISIGVVPFTALPETSSTPLEGEAVDAGLLAQSVLQADLVRSQLVQTVDLTAETNENLARGPSEKMKESAQSAGVLAIVWAKLYLSAGRWVMEAYAYEASQGNPVIRVKMTADTIRSMAHRFSDKLVYQFTGEEGIAQTQIAYQSEQKGRKGIYLMDYDGENPREVVLHKAMLLPPRWSFDATSIGYTVYDRGISTLYLLELATGSQTKIFSSPRLSFSPVWSGLGTEVAFASTKDGNSNIYRMNPRGEELKQLTFHRAADLSPTWSPTGQEIAFTSDRGGSPQIYIMDKDGMHVRRLTYAGDYNTSASWSPRGDWIAYACRNDQGFMKLCASTVNGQRRIEMTRGGTWDDESPSWARNGREIVYTSNRYGKKQIFSVRPDGTGQRRLTENEWENTDPVWAPQSR